MCREREKTTAGSSAPLRVGRNDTGLYDDCLCVEELLAELDERGTLAAFVLRGFGDGCYVRM